MRGVYTVLESTASMIIRILTCGSRTASEVLFFVRTKKSTQKKSAPDGAPFRYAFLLREKSRAHLPVRPFALPLAALTLRSAALGPALSRRDFLSRGPVARLPERDPFGALTQSLAVLRRAIRGGNVKTNVSRWLN